MTSHLGDNIRIARNAQKITQEKLAELSGLSLNFVSRIERTNTNNISLKNVIKIADALGIPVTQLLTSNQKDDTDYPNTKRLNHLLQTLPKDIAEDYANEFVNILRIQNQTK